MIKTWKDPDTGIVHAIDSEGVKGSAWEHAHEMPGLLVLSLEEIGERFFRRVYMRCGIFVQLDSDEFILPQGEALLRSAPTILRPWVTSRGAPTCVICAVVKPSEPMRNIWGSTLRGA